HDAQWHLGRGDESLATIEHALSLLPADEISPDRGVLLGSMSKTIMLRGKNAKAAEVARETLTVADALGDIRLRGQALNVLGTSLMALGAVDTGAAKVREALALAERIGIPWQQNSAYINLADTLLLIGRLREARAVVDEGLARDLRPNRMWLVILQGELA